MSTKILISDNPSNFSNIIKKAMELDLKIEIPEEKRFEEMIEKMNSKPILVDVSKKKHKK